MKLKADQNEFGFEHRATESPLCGKTHVRAFELTFDFIDKQLFIFKNTGFPPTRE